MQKQNLEDDPFEFELAPIETSSACNTGFTKHSFLLLIPIVVVASAFVICGDKMTLNLDKEDEEVKPGKYI